MLVLEESRRVSGTYKVVLIVFMCIGVSRRSKAIRDFFVVEALLFGRVREGYISLVFLIVCMNNDSWY